MSKLNLEKVIVKLPGDKDIIVKYKTSVEQILGLIDDEKISSILGVRVNNEVRNYDYEVSRNSKLEYVKYDSADGYRIYTRTVNFILYMALTKLYPKLKIEFCNAIDTNHYFLCKQDIITDEMVENIEKEMKDISNKARKIEKRNVPEEEAQVLYEILENKTKLLNMEHNFKGSTTMYFCDDIYNNMNGVLAPNTLYVKNFKLKKYRKGFVILFPNRDNINEVNKEIDDNKLYDVFERYENYNDINKTQMVYQINEQVINGTIGDTIRLSEVIHEKQMGELVKEIEKETI